MKRVGATVSLGLALALGACSSDGGTAWAAPELPMVRRQGYRIAVLPFTVSAPEDDFLIPEPGALGNVLSLGGLSNDAPPRHVAAHLLRRGIVWTLADSPFDVMALWVTDTELSHQQIDPNATSPEQIAKALGVDGVLYGDVTAWNRSYYGVESYLTAGLSLRLVDGASGRTLFEGSHTEQIAAGVTGGPTAVVSAGTEPVSGLDGGKLVTAGRKLVRHLAGQLSGREPRVMMTPEAGGGISPTLSFVSVAPDRDGMLVPGDRIRVIAIGTPGSDVRFSLGHYQTAIPMPAVAVAKDPRGDRATYVGTYVVQAGERLSPTRVEVSIEKLGLRQTRFVREPRVSISDAPK